MKNSFYFIFLAIGLAGCNWTSDIGTNGKNNTVQNTQAAKNGNGQTDAAKIGQIVKDQAIPDSKARTMGYINRRELNSNWEQSERIITNVDQNDFNGDELKEVQAARKIVDQMSPFKPGAIWVEGDLMWVHAYNPKSMSDRQRIEAESAIYTRLKKALPHYKIEVRLLQYRK